MSRACDSDAIINGFFSLEVLLKEKGGVDGVDVDRISVSWGSSEGRVRNDFDFGLIIFRG